MRILILFTASLLLIFRPGALIAEAPSQAQPAYEQKPLRFALVGKADHPYFTQAHLGCRKAENELDAVDCIYRAPGYADVQAQNALLEELIQSGIDGIAVSVLQPRFLAEHAFSLAKKYEIPVVTYDSGLDGATARRYPGLVDAYVGTDNVEYGRAFARYLKSRWPDGATICLLSGRPDSANLMERMQGFRAELSGDNKTRAPGRRLKGQNGWQEHSRCPLYNYEDTDVALHQLEFMLSRELENVDVLVSLGSWAQLYPQRYREIVQPYQHARIQRGVAILFADTLHSQIELQREGLADANIGQSPFEMGRLAMRALYQLNQGLEVDPIQYTPVHLCSVESLADCLPGTP